MSWTNELYKVYELAVNTDDGKTMLPISHSTANAQIELTITEDGEFVKATKVDKANAVTIIPVTADSATRSSGIAPMPLADKLQYVAGDFMEYEDTEKNPKSKGNECFAAYLEKLTTWNESKFTHPAVTAILAYVSKKEMMKDLIAAEIILLDPDTGKLPYKKDKNKWIPAVKIVGTIDQNAAFVRFIVSGKNGLCYTWLDKSLYDAFIKFDESNMTDIQLCYATSEMKAVTYKHPAKIRNSGDKAKLISANDATNFTYRGRFSNKEEAISVSYEYSQKMHNALKWLINRQIKSMAFGTMTLVVWNSALDFEPDITESIFGDVELEEYSSKPIFSEMLHKKIMGGRAEFDPESKVMIMGLDAATTGRLSISMYTELSESRFAENLEYWHKSTSWPRNKHIKDKYVNVLDSCSLPQIANCLYGAEVGQYLECDKKILGDLILRLLPCVTEKRKLPRDIIQTICNKASNPLAFDNEYNHRIVVENACALISKAQRDNENNLYYKGEIEMAYDPNCTDRSYLFGCLLAIADKAERDTYEKGEKRITNARRYWNAFSARPYQTWPMIEEKIGHYLEKEPWLMTKYTKHINEIMSKMSTEVFADNSKLSPMYLIGFHHYNALLWNANEDKNEEE